jgi:hypothetical protein
MFLPLLVPSLLGSFLLGNLETVSLTHRPQLFGRLLEHSSRVAFDALIDLLTRVWHFDSTESPRFFDMISVYVRVTNRQIAC